MNRLEIIEASPSDVIYVAKNLRETDLEELRLARGRDVRPEEHLLAAYDNATYCWVGLNEVGTPVTIFGANPVVAMDDPEREDIGSPWLLATAEVSRFQALFVVQVREYIQEIHTRYPYLVNRVWARNTPTIRWLERLGFEMLEPEPHGPYDAEFRFFRKEASYV